jgi:hypothetical protein
VSGANSKESLTMNWQKRSGRLSRRRPQALLSALVALSAFLAFAAQASAAEPLPAWSLQVTSFPTNFPPETPQQGENGPGYFVVAQNVGDEYTSGEFTIRDELPAGVTFSEVHNAYYGTQRRETPLACEAEDPHTVVCVGGVGSQPGLEPGGAVRLDLMLNVESPAPATLLNEVTVEGGGATTVSKELPTPVNPLDADYGFAPGSSGLYGTAVYGDGSVASQAASHPTVWEAATQNYTTFQRHEIFSSFASGGGTKDVVVTLPRGMVVNPQAVPKCTASGLEAHQCPVDSQVGTITLNLSLVSEFTSPIRPLYNMVPPAGAPAEFAFEILEGIYVHIEGEVRADKEYRLAAHVDDIAAQVTLGGVKTTFWGDPTSSAHDRVRGICLTQADSSEGETEDDLCPAEEQLDTPFLTMPSSCEGRVSTGVAINSWMHPEQVISRDFEMADPSERPFGIDGCNAVDFSPSVESRATTNLTDSPTGLGFRLHVPQNDEFGSLSEANLKDATVVLPEGMTVNPSAADGLGSCTPSQVDLHGRGPANCPDSAKVGTVEVKTQLLEKPVQGGVYLAKPFENPFGSMIALYIAAYDPRVGVALKIPGVVEPDPATGRLTAVFRDNPELPFEDLSLNFFNGARAPLTSPPTCGTQTTTTLLTPWTTPQGADASPSDSFETTAAASGGDCPTAASQLPNRLSFNAGTVAPQAGAFSPFVVRLARPDGSQRITGIDTTLPPGVTGKLAGIPYCSDAQIGAAAARSNPNEGMLEQNSPSCPAASEVGTVEVGAGSGPNPVYVSGRAYLAGPYKRAPLSLAVITPGVAGPFDLGTVVTRVALYVDPETAQIHAVSDPLPTILHGIALDVRSVALRLDRQGFTLNPTSCDPKKISGSIVSSVGQTTSVDNPFQVGSCSALPFKPQLALKLKGGTKRSQFPALTAVVTQPPGQANIGAVSVTLPHSAFLEQAHIRTICTRVQFAEGDEPGEKCPAASIYGRAEATTPLLAQPLSGPVFLRSSSHQLPDLVAALRGQVDVVLVGRVDSVKGRLRNRFETAPDAPVTKFVLEMQGGKKGLIVNSANLCKGSNKAALSWRGQNGKELQAQPLVKNSCKKGKKGAPRRGSKHGKHGR